MKAAKRQLGLCAAVFWIGVASMANAQISNVTSTSRSTAGTSSLQAQNVYNLLTSLETNARNGIKQTILGQHSQAHKETYPGQYWDRVAQITGRNPGFLEFDLAPYDGSSTYRYDLLSQSIEFATTRFLQGDSIIGYSFHQNYPGAPTKSFDNVKRQGWQNDAWFRRVIDKDGNTAEYQNFMKDLDHAADALSVLKQSNVPVLYRPFHEMNKSSFWWGNRSPDDYKTLWNLAYDYLVVERGLDNLLFVWSPYEWDGVNGSDPWDYYPGDDRVDVVGVDIYRGNPYFPAKYYNDLQQFNKPRIVAENDKMPVRWGDASFANVSEIDARPWVLWTIWGNLLEVNVNDESSPNQWNVSADYKAIKDTYSYYDQQNGYWRVLSGGPNGSYDWSVLIPEPATPGLFVLGAAPLLIRRRPIGRDGGRREPLSMVEKG